MKKFLAILLAVLMLAAQCTSAFAELTNGSTVTLPDNQDNTGYSGIPFGEGYYGYCLDFEKKGVTAEWGMDFTVSDVGDYIIDNEDGTDISNAVKIVIVEFFDKFFKNAIGEYRVKDAAGTEYSLDKNGRFSIYRNGGWSFVDKPEGAYLVVPENNENPLQMAIWALTNSESEHIKQYGDFETAADAKAKSDAGVEIDDHHIATINGLEFTFDFKVMLSKNGTIQQNLVAFRVVPGAVEAPKPTPTPTPTPVPMATLIPAITPSPSPTPIPGGEIEPPDTGDGADFVLWTLVLLMGAVAMLTLRRKQSA